MTKLTLPGIILAIWTALLIFVLPASAGSSKPPGQKLPINAGGPMQPAPTPEPVNPDGPIKVHCDCVRLVNGHTVSCCP